MKNSFEKNVKAYMIGIEKLAKSLKLEVKPIINFKGGKVPLVGRFAIFLLVRVGGYLDTQFTNKQK